MQAVIMAGGKGTRLFSLTKDEIPKPMVSFCGKPMIEHLILQLAENRITDIVICLGHLGVQISDYLGDGAQYGVMIHYVMEEVPLGTAGALYYAKEYIQEEFLLVYADLLLDVDWVRMLAFHKEKSSVATLFVHPNSHPYDSDLVICNADGRVTGFDFKDHIRDYDYENCVNAGAVIFSPVVLNCLQQAKKISLEKDLIGQLLQMGQPVFAYRSPEYIKDIGTPERLYIAEEEYRSGMIGKCNLQHKQKAVFLDRDGTINQYKGLITEVDQLELIENIEKGLKRLNESEYLALVVTNQPVIARGDCTEEMLAAIHKRLFTLLGKMGVYVDDLCYCPHHTDKGFPGERPELKYDCDCRKPKIGMIIQFAEKYNIDLTQSWMIGDTFRDVQTGANAGLQTILIHSTADDERTRFNAEPDLIARNFEDAINYILNGRKMNADQEKI